ncbi:MAG TPA: S1 RNA-binding domain-containing protein [Thermoanaerobaculia bacterium]|jgi:small subunit ribosomal protein S1|nr:S1 RNA-binding domain-containing protein [Thermoanaerobaculia bacterium]
MNDQENQQENQDSGQILAEFEQEAPATSEDATVDPQVHGSEASAPAMASETQGSTEAAQEAQPQETQAPEAQAQETEAQAPEAQTPEAQTNDAEPAAAKGGPQENQNQDFGQILAEFEGDAPKSEAPAVGQKVKGKILSITEEWAFLDLGGKAEGRIAAADLKDAEGNPTVKEGDTLEATVTGTDPETGALLLRRKAGGGKGKRAAAEVPAEIRQAHEAGLPIEGLVTGLNKGGAEVQVFGMRAFCPLSQLDLRYVENPQQFVGQKLMFKVNRLEEGNRGGRGPNIVLSRRQLLEEEQQSRAAETREKLQVGAVLTGRVTSLTTYGAFIDLGGIEGMLHVSEIGHSRTTHPQDVFTVGQEVEVQVIKIEQGKDEKRPERISLSRRALESDPWQDAAARFPEGTEATGRVMRLETFGAFVELAPGLEGLVHISEMGAGRRLNHSREAAEQGQDVQVRVLGVDIGRRRISLSMNTGANAGMGGGAGMGAGMGASDRGGMGGGGEQPRGDRRRGGGGGSGGSGRQQDFSRSERGDRGDRGDRSRGGERGGSRDEDAYARSGAAAPTATGSGFGSMADFFSRLKKG